MQAARSPVIAVIMAAVGLACIGALAFQNGHDERLNEQRTAAERAAALAIRDSEEAKARLERVMRELDALEAQMTSLTARMAALSRELDRHDLSGAERRRIQSKLRRLAQEFQELLQRRSPARVYDDRLIEPVRRDRLDASSRS